MEQNLWTILITYATVQCFVLIPIIVFRQQDVETQKKWLAFILFLAGAQCLNFLFEYFRWYEAAPHFIWVSAPLWFMVGPALYFFSKSAVSMNVAWRWYDYIHFLPFIGAILYIGRFYLLDGSSKIATLEFFYETYGRETDYFFFAFLFSELIYATYSLYLFNIYFKKVGDEYSSTIIYQTRWIRFLLISFIAFFVLSFGYSILLMYDFEYFIQADYITYLYLALFVQVLGFSAILKPESFFRTPIDLGKTKENKTELELEQSFKEVQRFMNNEKPYINPGLRLSDLSRDLDIPAHKLSKIINKVAGQNFFEFINSYRVEEVKDRLPRTEYEHLTMEGIAEECGFNSSASFYRVFKQQTQMTPSQFLERVSDS